MSELSRQPYPWQLESWQALTGRLTNGRFPHALLLSGPAGTGKRHFARLLAEALLCEAPETDGIPCGKCRSCHLLASGNHPDMLLVDVEEGKRTIGIETIRDLTAFISLKSHYGSRKAVVLDSADALTLNAANALLKTLEEPAPDSYLLLCSDQPAGLLATIRSRCQTQLFTPVSATIAIPWLEQQLGIPTQRAELLHALSGALPLRALELADEEKLQLRNTVFLGINDLLKGQDDPIAIAAVWYAQGAIESLGWLQLLLMDAARLMGGVNDGMRNPDHMPLLESLAESLDLVSLHHYLDKVQHGLALSKGQANLQLLLEELLVSWPRATMVRSGRPGVASK